jgi:hypothetical protein
MHKLLSSHSCSTVQNKGWGGIKNGDLLQRAEDEFDLFITSDQNIRYQQNLAVPRIAILELSTNPNSPSSASKTREKSQMICEAQLLSHLPWFVSAVTKLPGIRRVTLLGSITTNKH